VIFPGRPGVVVVHRFLRQTSTRGGPEGQSANNPSRNKGLPFELAAKLFYGNLTPDATVGSEFGSKCVAFNVRLDIARCYETNPAVAN
jgi:hypothetical protein